MKRNSLLVRLGVLALLVICTSFALARWQDRRDEVAIRSFCLAVIEKFSAELHLVRDAYQCKIEGRDTSVTWAEYTVRLDGQTRLWLVRTKPLNPFEDGAIRTAIVNRNSGQQLKLELDPRMGWLMSDRNPTALD